MTRTADVIVLGVGTCGEDMALRLVAAGLDVIGIEERLVGGECPYFACLPTKAMIRCANLLAEARRADGLVGRVEATGDWARVATRVRDEITGGWDDAGAVSRLEERGGRFVRGRGRLLGHGTVAVGDTTLEARRGIIVATGSRPVIPPIPGLDHVHYWTTRDAVRAASPPASLAILGGGAVGCELAQVFARFGTRVTLLEAADRLLPGEEPEASAAVAAALARDGVNVRCGAQVSEILPRDGGVALALTDDPVVEADRLLLAVGRTANVEGLGAEAAGVDVAPGYVVVDGRMRAGPGVWAVGDVTGRAMVTHVALYQASIAVADVLGREPRPADYGALPRATFTDPEVGGVGSTEREAREAGLDVDVVVKQVPATFRGWLHAAGGEGLIKLVVDRGSGTLAGATVVGPRGVDVMGMLALAIHASVPIDDLVSMIYPFPTFLGGIGEALGAYGRGLVTVLDPGNEPLVTDGRVAAPSG
jgi:pyruvate/2-oxoglutarate dehydrogenase complex dihydrolipoamide dehydrogenase (E3) component